MTLRDYHLKDNVLYRKGSTNDLLVVPKILQRELINEAHSIPISGHLGYKKIMDKLQHKYYWKNMCVDIIRFINSCEICQQKNRPIKRQGYLKPIVATYPFEIVSTDVIGPYPSSNNGNRFIVVALDLFSKWAITKAIPDQTARTIATFLEEDVFCKYGSPKYLLSDNGSAYVSRLLNEHAKLYKVNQRFTCPYSPEGNGGAERLNRTIQNMLSKYVSIFNHDNWDVHLPQCTFAYNSTKHSTTHKSPFEITFGRIPDMPYDFPVEHSFHNWSDHLERLKQIQDIVRTTMKIEQEKYRERENRKRKQYVHEEGDVVLLLDPIVPSGISKKLYRPYWQKCKVIKRHNDLVYTVRSLVTRKTHKVNIK